MRSECLFFVIFVITLPFSLGFWPALGSSGQSLVGLTPVSQGPWLSAQRHLDQELVPVYFQSEAIRTCRAQETARKPVVFPGKLVAAALAVIFFVAKCYRIVTTDRGPITRKRRLSKLEGYECTDDDDDDDDDDAKAEEAIASIFALADKEAEAAAKDAIAAIDQALADEETEEEYQAAAAAPSEAEEAYQAAIEEAYQAAAAAAMTPPPAPPPSLTGRRASLPALQLLPLLPQQRRSSGPQLRRSSSGSIGPTQLRRSSSGSISSASLAPRSLRKKAKVSILNLFKRAKGKKKEEYEFEEEDYVEEINRFYYKVPTDELDVTDGVVEEAYQKAAEEAYQKAAEEVKK